MPSVQGVLGVPTFCIITGASRGLGREIALSLGSQLGPNSLLTLTARSSVDLEETRKQVAARAPEVSVRLVSGDLGVESKVEKVIASLFEGVDGSKYQHALLVHNAGSLGDTSNVGNLKATPESLQKYFLLNVTSCISLSSFFLKTFPKREGLRRTIIAITSLCALQATKSLSLYCSGKAARNMVMKNIAIEDPDVRVLNWAPGVLNTQMHHDLIANVQDAEIKEMMISVESTQYYLTPAASCKVLMQVLREDSFESGAHIDIWDVEQKE
ncbi:sepiapterin reductase-like [Asterias amurensis]|uniref:sepiapterin reductase-like n=1 Tax=Asterias amurensis TaxID=7602 RepID=UPI003AB2880B